MPDTMLWLHERIPLTLLIDLLAEDGPDSHSILQSEPADLAWTRTTTAA
jgi:hypothetical protein